MKLTLNMPCLFRHRLTVGFMAVLSRQGNMSIWEYQIWGWSFSGTIAKSQSWVEWQKTRAFQPPGPSNHQFTQWSWDWLHTVWALGQLRTSLHNQTAHLFLSHHGHAFPQAHKTIFCCYKLIHNIFWETPKHSSSKREVTELRPTRSTLWQYKTNPLSPRQYANNLSACRTPTRTHCQHYMKNNLPRTISGDQQQDTGTMPPLRWAQCLSKHGQTQQHQHEWTH